MSLFMMLGGWDVCSIETKTLTGGREGRREGEKEGGREGERGLSEELSDMYDKIVQVSGGVWESRYYNHLTLPLSFQHDPIAD